MFTKTILVISFNFHKELFLLTGSVKTKTSQNFLGHLSLKLFTFIKTPSLIKNAPFLIMLIISSSFNNATLFCKNTCVCVLINQYSTGLFVSYSVGRKSHQTVCQSAQTRQKKNPIVRNNKQNFNNNDYGKKEKDQIIMFMLSNFSSTLF